MCEQVLKTLSSPNVTFARRGDEGGIGGWGGGVASQGATKEVPVRLLFVACRVPWRLIRSSAQPQSMATRKAADAQRLAAIVMVVDETVICDAGWCALLSLFHPCIPGPGPHAHTLTQPHYSRLLSTHAAQSTSHAHRTWFDPTVCLRCRQRGKNKHVTEKSSG